LFVVEDNKYISHSFACSVAPTHTPGINGRCSGLAVEVLVEEVVAVVVAVDSAESVLVAVVVEVDVEVVAAAVVEAGKSESDSIGGSSSLSLTLAHSPVVPDVAGAGAEGVSDMLIVMNNKNETSQVVCVDRMGWDGMDRWTAATTTTVVGDGKVVLVGWRGRKRKRTSE
jgi:hypothetical protein